MSAPFVAEIRIFANHFAPVGWATCDGQLMPISQNTALFSLLGTTYGGDGKSTFRLPDLNGSMPMHPGQGQGLGLRFLGESGGAATVALTAQQIPYHNHQLQAVTVAASQLAPGPSTGFAANAAGQVNHIFSQNVAGAELVVPNPLLPAGADQAHNNRQPYLGMLFCIALQGVYPAHS